MDRAPVQVVHAAPASPIAGRIAATDSLLDGLVSGWLDYLARNGRSDRTVVNWRRMIAADRAAMGIFTREQVDYATIVGGLEALRQHLGWSAATLRCHLAAWKSLDRHVKRVESGDLQAAEGPSDTEPGDGARAATVDEARRMLAAAWDMERHDGRARSPRTLYLLCMFAAGCREDDHWHWRWANVRLDAPVPHVRWERGLQKNKRLMVVALAPELAAALRNHRAAMKRLSRTRPTVTRLIRHRLTGRLDRVTLPVDPDADGSPVFVAKPPRDVFRRDRERADIPYQDDRGRIFSPHSARKFFKTTLVSLGVSHDMTEYLMRHAPRVAGRYYDPSLEEQAAALAGFPALSITSQTPVTKAPAHNRAGISPESLDGGGRNADAHGVTRMPHTRPHNPSKQPRQQSFGMCAASDISAHADGALSSGFSGISPRSGHVQSSAFAAKVGAVGAQALTRTLASLLAAAAELVRCVGDSRGVTNDTDDQRNACGRNACG